MPVGAAPLRLTRTGRHNRAQQHLRQPLLRSPREKIVADQVLKLMSHSARHQ